MWRVLGIDSGGDLWVFSTIADEATALETATRYSRYNIHSSYRASSNRWRYFVCSQSEWDGYWKEKWKKSREEQDQREGRQEPSPAAP